MFKTVAVIGAGALGLSATKVFIEDGWKVTTYESRDYVGGLWKDSDDSTISVHATTIFNSSKYRAALSDFPFAVTDDDYPTAAQLHKGNVIHSIDFHRPEDFKDQNVLIVGMHATAQDVTNALSDHAKHVYLSHRGGLLLLPRYTQDGAVFDASAGLTATFIMAFMTKKFPSLWFWILDMIFQKVSKKAFPGIPDACGLNPPPSFAVSTPLMGDIFWPLLQSNFAEPTHAVAKVTGPRSVELTDGRILEDVDSIIYCTGYNFDIPDGFVAEDIHPYPGKYAEEIPNLYHNIFPLHQDESIRSSFAYLGQAAVPFPGFAQHELNAMAISQTWLGNSPLPTHRTMLAWREQNIAEKTALKAKYKPHEGSTFYPVFMNFGDHFQWLDDTAGTGLYENLSLPLFNWRAWKLWWEDKELYNMCAKGLFTPLLWRLFETGKRKAIPIEECEAMIMIENEKVEEKKRRRMG